MSPCNEVITMPDYKKMLWEEWFYLEWDATRRQILGEEKWYELLKKKKEEEISKLNGQDTRRKDSKVQRRRSI